MDKHMRLEGVKRKLQPADQHGFASVVIALVLIVVLGLLTVGFAQLTRHEQKQALNSQLATQAYYAAESGVNDVVYALEQGSNFSGQADNGKCLTTIPYAAPFVNNAGQVNTATGAEYTCVMVNLFTTSLTKTLDAGQGWTIISDSRGSGGNNNITSITVSWKSHSTPPKTANCPTPQFLPEDQWSTANCPAVLQFSMTPVAGSLTRTNLINTSFTAYMYPSAGGGTVAYAPGGAGQAPVVAGACNGGTCSVKITLGARTGPFLFHTLDYYDSSDVTISAANGASAVNLSGQAVIDSTGKARNVLKRILVHVPSDNNEDLVDYSIEGQNICKRIVTQLDNSFPDDPYKTIPSGSSGNPCNSPNAQPCTSCNNNANITSGGAACAPNCVKPGGGNAPPGGTYHWNASFKNVSVNNSPVVSCVWTFSDGSPAQRTGCNFGDTISVTFKNPGFPPPPYPLGCVTVPEYVTLTLTLQTGPPAKYTYKRTMPYCW